MVAMVSLAWTADKDGYNKWMTVLVEKQKSDTRTHGFHQLVAASSDGLKSAGYSHLSPRGRSLKPSLDRASPT